MSRIFLLFFSLLLIILLCILDVYSKSAQILLFNQLGFKKEKLDEKYKESLCKYGKYNKEKDRCEFIKYEFYAIHDTWWNNKNNCENRNGHLATIKDANENNILYNLISGYHNIFVGGTDYQQEGNWTWITGEPWNFKYWDSGQPDNSFSGAEDYLAISWSNGHHKWNDSRSNAVSDQGYICEYEYDPNFVINLPPICPEGYSYIQEDCFSSEDCIRKGLCVKEF